MEDLKGRIAAVEAFLEAGNHAAAEREVGEILKADPENVSARRLLVRSLLDRGKKKEALKLASELIASFPDSPEAHFSYLMALAQNGKEEEARQHLAFCREQFPGEFILWDELEPYLEAFLGNLADALKLSEERAVPEEARLKMKVELLLDEGRYNEAASIADELIARDPSNSNFHLLKAVASYMGLRFSDARKTFRKIKELEPEEKGLCNEVIITTYMAVFPPFLVAFVLWLFIQATLKFILKFLQSGKETLAAAFLWFLALSDFVSIKYRVIIILSTALGLILAVRARRIGRSELEVMFQFVVAMVLIPESGRMMQVIHAGMVRLGTLLHMPALPWILYGLTLTYLVYLSFFLGKLHRLLPERKVVALKKDY